MIHFKYLKKIYLRQFRLSPLQNTHHFFFFFVSGSASDASRNDLLNLVFNVSMVILPKETTRSCSRVEIFCSDVKKYLQTIWRIYSPGHYEFGSYTVHNLNADWAILWESVCGDMRSKVLYVWLLSYM